MLHNIYSELCFKPILHACLYLYLYLTDPVLPGLFYKHLLNWLNHSLNVCGKIFKTPSLPNHKSYSIATFNRDDMCFSLVFRFNHNSLSNQKFILVGLFNLMLELYSNCILLHFNKAFFIQIKLPKVVLEPYFILGTRS